jgi:hypothetical protein
VRLIEEGRDETEAIGDVICLLQHLGSPLGGAPVPGLGEDWVRIR